MKSFDFDEAFMHNAPRFGHSRDISMLFGSEESRKDYKNGVISFSLFLLSILIFWLAFNVFFAIRGKRRYGCVAGRILYNPELQDKRRVNCRYRIVQFCFVIFAFGVLAGNVALVKRGLPRLQEASVGILEFVEFLVSVLYDGRVIAVSADELITSVQSSSIRNFSDLGDYCATSSSVYMDDLNSKFSTMISSLDALDGMLEEYKADAVKQNIESFQKRSSQVERIVETFMLYSWMPKMYAIIVCLTVTFILVLMSVSLLKNQFKGSRAMLSYFLMPVFGIIVTLGWIAMIFAAAAATMNSDFCYGDGENGSVSTIENALIEYGLDSTHILSQSFQYYKSSCTFDNPWEGYIFRYGDSIQKTMNDANAFLTYSSECGSMFAVVSDEVTKVRQSLDQFSSLFDQVLQYTDCDRITPLYTRLFNGASCSSSLNGLSWTFYSLLTISFFGFLMISFRAALYKVKNISSFLGLEKGIKEYAIGWNEFNTSVKEYDDVESAYSMEGSDVDEYAVQNKISDDTRITAASHDSNECYVEVEPLSPLTTETNHTFN